MNKKRTWLREAHLIDILEKKFSNKGNIVWFDAMLSKKSARDQFFSILRKEAVYLIMHSRPDIFITQEQSKLSGSANLTMLLTLQVIKHLLDTKTFLLKLEPLTLQRVCSVLAIESTTKHDIISFRSWGVSHVRCFVKLLFMMQLPRSMKLLIKLPLMVLIANNRTTLSHTEHMVLCYK